VIRRLALEKTIFGEHFSYLKSVTRHTPKLTIPAPSMLHYRGGSSVVDTSVYPRMDEFWSDLKEVYADEVEGLGKLGCTYLQLDDTSLAYLNDPTQRDYVQQHGGDGQNQHLIYIDLINGALAKKPAGMTVCTHLCRGNFRSSWVASGGYDYVAEALFNELHVDGFFLEYDDERSGGFEPLRYVPKGKYVVLGVVTSKRAALENKDDLKRRIDAAAKFVPLEQICLSPQCGFSSTQEGNAVTLDDQIAKLRLVVETAREIWG
jgi:5-methyltetrahydropteroyltriglutamate--homocysteine methyltransferase